MKVLAVEDDPVARSLLEASLRMLGYQPVVAVDGEDAWLKLKLGSIRMVVCDWRLPRMDGLALCRRVRAECRDYVYFILISTTESTDEAHDEALAAGVDDFLGKPVGLRELRMRLHVAQRILGFTAQVQELQSFLPICGYCKKVRDDHNYWQQIETYLRQRSGTEFSHGVCPDCYDRIVVPQLTELGLTPPA
jgi:sigma-B regulation protein RsbU (phosphoserine phosphatase)